MRCDLCPLGSDDDVCPEAEGKYGIEHKDGVLGCKHPRNWAEKRDKEYCDHLGEMGTDMGIEMSLSEIDMKFLIETCEHMIGLDYKRPYCRHGKAFYKPYRNYYCAPERGHPLLDYLSKISLVTRESDGEGVWYTLTSTGLKWLGRQLKITIKEEKKWLKKNT